MICRVVLWHAKAINKDKLLVRNSLLVNYRPEYALLVNLRQKRIAILTKAAILFCLQKFTVYDTICAAYRERVRDKPFDRAATYPSGQGANA